MTWENSAITIATLLPLAGALVIALVPRRYEKGVRALGIVFTGAALVFAIAITFTFDYGASGLQFQLDTSWIPAIDWAAAFEHYVELDWQRRYADVAARFAVSLTAVKEHARRHDWQRPALCGRD